MCQMFFKLILEIELDKPSIACYVTIHCMSCYHTLHVKAMSCMRVNRFLLSIVLLTIILTQISCKRKLPLAGGKKTEIITVCDEVTYNLIEKALDFSLLRIIYTPTKEYIFSIKVVSPDKFPIYRYRRNIFIVGKLGTPLIDSLLAPEAREQAASNKAYIFGREDLYAKGQSVLIVAAPKSEMLPQIIESDSALIFNYFAEGIRKRLKNGLYKDGYQEDIAERLRVRYGFSIHIPPGWYLVKEDPEGRFVKFMRHYPDRVISIYWENKPRDFLTKEEAISIRDNIGKNYYEGDFVDGKRTKFYFVKFHGITAQKLDGIWQNNEKVMGGPFIAYLFSTHNKFYLIDMHVFAPGEKKWYWLQQLELICDTFETF